MFVMVLFLSFSHTEEIKVKNIGAHCTNLFLLAHKYKSVSYPQHLYFTNLIKLLIILACDELVVWSTSQTE